MRTSGQVPAEHAALSDDMTFFEGLAVTAGLEAAAAFYSPPAGTLVVIATDNETTAALLTGRGKPAFKARNRWVMDAYAETLRRTGMNPSVRLVRGHLGNATPRNAVNSWCDRECRRLLKALRAEAHPPP